MPRGYTVDKLVTSPEYFAAMGIPLLYGRDFTAADEASTTPVTIISRSVARRFWPPDGADAIGKRITQVDSDPKPKDWQTIVGVVGDVAQQRVTADRDAALYLPTSQTQNRGFMNDVTFVIRSSQDARELAP